MRSIFSKAKGTEKSRAFSIEPLVQQPSRVHAAVGRAFSFLLSATEEEALFAIFGHWGRGKSFVACTIAERQSPSVRTVFFSAWRYPHSPECWVFLYQTLVDEIKASGTFAFLGTVLRRNVLKNGVWPAIVANFSAFLVVLGLVNNLVTMQWFVSALGLSTVLLLGRMWFSGWKVVSSLKDTYATLPSHRDRLGIQEAIGDDIRLLVNAWVGRNRGLFIELALMILVLIVLWVGLPLGYVLTSGARTSLGSWFKTDPAIIWSIWNTFLICFVATGLRYPRQTRVLIVIEDLDRCTEGVALHLIESIALLLEPRKPSGIIQAVALIDEETLDAEIVAKFPSSSSAKAVYAT